MPIRNPRQYRAFSSAFAPVEGTQKRFDSAYYVEGYAARYERYKLFRWQGQDYFEIIPRAAFTDADLSDVVLRYDHEGRVYARNHGSKPSLVAEPDDAGLFVAADLSRTSGAKSMYEDIAAELCTQMSWAFAVEDETFDEQERTWIINRVGRVYDVSPVSIPANPNTEISARAMDDGAIVRRIQELEGRQRDALAQRIATYTKIKEII